MAYLGNAPVVGDSTNSFRLLDDIASFTLTFDATDTAVVSIANDTLSFTNHRFVNGQKVTYTDGGGTAIGGLTDGTSYFIIKVDQNTIKLATNASNAASSTAINLTSGAAGGSHTLNVKFDGVNTKFKATFNNGKKAKISRAAQLSLSINGVVQQPQDSSSPSVGYGVEADSTIVFSTAPVATDVVFGSFIGEVAASFDIEDNTVDNFTGDGSTTIFNLSKEVPSSQDVLVTIDGVTQYPSDGSTTRAYSVIDQALTFVSAPADGTAIQARHIGFAGATTSAVTGLYGRTGNVALISTDDISVQNISGVGATFTSNVNIQGVLTYEDVTNVDSVGLITARSGISVSGGDIKVGSATTLSQDNIFTTGIITATSFVGSGANLTGVASTENIRTNTNATFLQNVTVVGTSTVTGNIVPSSDSATDIGTNSVRFQNAYVDTYYGSGANLTGIDTDLVSDTSPQLGGNLDVNGKNIVLANSGGANDDRIVFGSSANYTLFFDGSDGAVQVTDSSAKLRLGGPTVQVVDQANAETMAKFISDGAVELYYDNSKKFETNSTGTTLFCTANGNNEGPKIEGSSSMPAILNFQSDAGANNDDKCRFYQHQTGGQLILQDFSQGSFNNMANFRHNGAVELYHAGTKRFETSSSGATVNGSLTAANLTVGNGYYIYFSSTSGFSPRIGNQDGGSGTNMTFHTNNIQRMMLQENGTLRPSTNNSYDLGTTSDRWRNIYTNDLQLSNEGSKNDVDGTWGNYTIQEGESDLFLINNRSGKKYKFNLTEVS